MNGLIDLILAQLDKTMADLAAVKESVERLREQVKKEINHEIS